MLKQTILAAFAIATCSAFAQNGMMMDVDAKSSKPAELAAFLDMDAYKKLSAPDAYVLTSFVSGLPGNYQTAILRGLVMSSQEARQSMMKNQDAANMMAPMGSTMTKMDSMSMDMKPPRSYYDAIETLQKGQDATDQGLIATLFMARPFTSDFLMSPHNERALDAITKYFAANAKASEPVRLKYTSLAPHTYTSPVIPR